MAETELIKLSSQVGTQKSEVQVAEVNFVNFAAAFRGLFLSDALYCIQNPKFERNLSP